tara:strand:+ start:13235 stop:14461 length:1227 start_codon:yes stop_codon:yes gene_type:complete
MPLFARTYQQLLASSLNDLSTETNLSRLSPGGKARALLESHNRRLEDVYDTFDLNVIRAFLSSATGQFLDLFGQLLAEPRQTSALALAGTTMQVQKFYVTTGTFGDINNGAPITIQAGAILSSKTAGKGTTYRLTETAVLPASSSTYWVGVEAQVPGDAANVGSASLVFHDFEDYEDVLNNTLLTTNVHAIANGRDPESDTNYRFRLTQKITDSATANETALRLAALVTPGVADVTIKKRYYGIGTVLILVESTTPSASAGLLTAVQARVNSVKAGGEKIYVKGPREIGLTFEIAVHYKKSLTTDDLVLIEESIEDSIEDYLTSLGIAGNFDVNRFVAEIFDVSDEIVDLGAPNEPLDVVHIYRPSRLEDNRFRETLLGDYEPAEDERVILEQTVTKPVVLRRIFVRS